jgi:hypothetical protein
MRDEGEAAPGKGCGKRRQRPDCEGGSPGASRPLEDWGQAGRARAADAHRHGVEPGGNSGALWKIAANDDGQEHSGHTDGRSRYQRAGDEPGAGDLSTQGKAHEQKQEQQGNGALQAESSRKPGSEQPEDPEAQDRGSGDEASPETPHGESLLHVGQHGGKARQSRPHVEGSEDQAKAREQQQPRERSMPGFETCLGIRCLFDLEGVHGKQSLTFHSRRCGGRGP